MEETWEQTPAEPEEQRKKWIQVAANVKKRITRRKIRFRPLRIKRSRLDDIPLLFGIGTKTSKPIEDPFSLIFPQRRRR